MKRLISMLLFIVSIATTVCSCSADENQHPLAGTYLYEKEGFGGQFNITLNEDGTFSYYVGFLSSYIGMGEWTMEEDVICLRDRSVAYVNYFKLKDGDLVFIQEGSTNFMYLTVKDGERFVYQPDEE